MKKTALSLFIFWMFLIGITSAQEPPARVTILYDAFGKPSTLKRGWGYSALVEYGGKRVLFDSGGGLKYVLSLNPKFCCFESLWDQDYAVESYGKGCAVRFRSFLP
jgi:hypothetical protein